MKKITFIQWTAIVIVLFCVLLLSGIIKSNSFGIDSALIGVWNKRADLQKVFPDPASSGLVEWAKKYGWREDDSLIGYSPYGDKIEAQNKVITDLLKRIELLTERVNSLDKNWWDRDRDGEWIKCCANNGNINCGNYALSHDCDTRDIYIWTKNFIKFKI